MLLVALYVHGDGVVAEVAPDPTAEDGVAVGDDDVARFGGLGRFGGAAGSAGPPVASVSRSGLSPARIRALARRVLRGLASSDLVSGQAVYETSHSVYIASQCCGEAEAPFAVVCATAASESRTFAFLEAAASDFEPWAQQYAQAGGAVARGTCRETAQRRLEDLTRVCNLRLKEAGVRHVDVPLPTAAADRGFRRYLSALRPPPLWMLSHEHVFGDYYFLADERDAPPSNPLVSFSWARTRDPLNHAEELYAMLHLDPGAHARRSRVSLAVVIDVSASALATFRLDSGIVRCDALLTNTLQLLQRLSVSGRLASTDDEIALVLFDGAGSNVVLPRTPLSSLPAMFKPCEERLALACADTPPPVSELARRDAVVAAMRIASDLVRPPSLRMEAGAEVRVLLALCPSSSMDADPIDDIVATASSCGVHLTLLTVDHLPSPEHMQSLRATRGSSWYPVHSARECAALFRPIFVLQSSLPAVYDCAIHLTAENAHVVDVAAERRMKDGLSFDQEHVHVGPLPTCFPVERTLRGGIVLVKLLPIRGAVPRVSVTATYVPRDGGGSVNVQLEHAWHPDSRDGSNGSVLRSSRDAKSGDDVDDGLYSSNSIRKAVMVTRLVNLLQNLVVESQAKRTLRARPADFSPSAECATWNEALRSSVSMPYLKNPCSVVEDFFAPLPEDTLVVGEDYLLHLSRFHRWFVTGVAESTALIDEDCDMLYVDSNLLLMLLRSGSDSTGRSSFDATEQSHLFHSGRGGFYGSTESSSSFSLADPLPQRWWSLYACFGCAGN